MRNLYLLEMALQKAEEQVAELEPKAERMDAIDADRSGVEAQDQAWVEYCASVGWDSEKHPSARASFSEGFLAGWAVDKSFIGDDRSEMSADLAKMRVAVEELKRKLKEARGTMKRTLKFVEGLPYPPLWPSDLQSIVRKWGKE